MTRRWFDLTGFTYPSCPVGQTQPEEIAIETERVSSAIGLKPSIAAGSSSGRAIRLFQLIVENVHCPPNLCRYR
jgi:hypothetical protein